MNNNYDERPLGMSDEEWTELLINGYFASDCPQEVKNAFMQQNGFKLADELHNEIWHQMPEYIENLRKKARAEGRITMYTPDAMIKITKVISLLKQLAELSGEDINISIPPVSTTYISPNYIPSVYIVAEIAQLSLSWKDKSKNIFEDLMSVADNVNVSLNFDETQLSLGIFNNDAVIVRKIKSE